MNTRNLSLALPPALSLALLLLLALAGSPAFAERAINEAADVHPQGEIEISNIAGRIEVEAWDQDRVEVTGTLGRGVERLEFRTQDRHTLVQVVHPSGARNVGPSELFVRMPRASRVVAVSVSADVSVRGVHGAQRLQSVSGDISTAMVKEDVQLKTVNGDIQVDGNDSPGLLTITTVSGDATVRAVAGEVVLQTVSGTFDVNSDQLGRARIRTTSGDATLRSGLAQGARVEMEAVNGTLRLVIAGEPDAEFTIETLNGQINNAFGPEPVRTSRYGPGRELRFTTGNGSARVTMETVNGDIILRTE
jgi:DUF4097 and DUF4098 domain-containing protein YvlB